MPSTDADRYRSRFPPWGRLTFGTANLGADFARTDQDVRLVASKN